MWHTVCWWNGINTLAASRLVIPTFFDIKSSIGCSITKGRFWLILATATRTPEWQPPSPATSGRPTTKTATRPSTRTSLNSFSWTAWYEGLISMTFSLRSSCLQSPWLLSYFIKTLKMCHVDNPFLIFSVRRDEWPSLASLTCCCACTPKKLLALECLKQRWDFQALHFILAVGSTSGRTSQLK